MATITVGGLQDDDRVDEDENEVVSGGDEYPSYSPPPATTSLNNSYGQTNMSAGSYSSPAADEQPPKPKPRFGGGDTCPRCKKTVYFAEARDGPNNIKFHKPCFVCAICKKVLDSTFTEKQGEIYCKGCYARQFGPKTFGYSPGSTLETTPSPQQSWQASQSPQPSWKPSQSPQQLWKASQSPNRTPGSTGSVNRTPGSTGSAPSPSRWGGGEKCPRCSKTVYAAEAKEGPNNIKYHRPCFSCMACAKTLDSHFAERQGDIYCKPCYNRLFGPKGFGHPGAS